MSAQSSVQSPVRNIVVTGKSGAGKQPRIDVLVETYGLTQLSTGNIFRAYLGAYKQVRAQAQTEGLWEDGSFSPDADISAALAPACEGSEVEVEAAVLGFKAAQYVDRGFFVPDDITNALLAAAFKANGSSGMVLDGYPRTPDQSQYLLSLVEQEGSGIDLILMVENEDDAIVARTTGRRICPNKTCGKVYHVEFKPPAAGNLCKVCGSEVILRSDDTEDKIRTRLAEFQAKAMPAIQVLQQAGIPMVGVEGNLPVFTEELVRESVMSVVEPALAR